MLWITMPLVVISTVLTVGGTLLALRGEIWDWYEKSVVSGMVSIVVKDDGRGIDSDDINRLFNFFEREDDATSVGWGLGLAIVKMLSELQGGTCLINNSSTGVAFEIVLPHDPVAG